MANWKSLFIKDDREDEKQKEEKVEVVEKPATKTTSFGSMAIVTDSTVRSETTVGTSTMNYVEHFDNVIQKAQVESPGYKEFSVSLRKMDGKPYTDQQKIETIYSVLESQGVTQAKLVNTAEKLIGIIQSEKNDFDREMEASLDTGVIVKRKQADQLQKENEELTVKIQENSTLINELNTKAILTEQQLASEKSAFESALNTRIGIINDHINKIKLYLNGTTI